MSKAKALIGIIFLGVIALLLINVVNASLTGRTVDFYLVRETTNAAMLDAIDESFYAEFGVVRIDSEKFVENFLRRFANEADPSRDYDISFFNINEAPPMVSVQVNTRSNSVAAMDEGIEHTTTVDAILESLNTTDQLVFNAIWDDRRLGAMR